MAGREVREYTNLTDPKDKKWGKGKDKIDDEDVTFHRMVAKMQDVAGERGGYLHGRGALDSDDLLYLKEQMEAEEDAERLLRRTEKRAFAAFKKAASLADSSPASLPLPLRVEPKTKSGIRQQDLLKNIVEIRPKRHRVSSPSGGNTSSPILPAPTPMNGKSEHTSVKVLSSAMPSNAEEMETKPENVVRSLLGLTYGSSDEDD
ncbi:ankyrin repeat protein [Tasmannia lanceolata]|uniref:ankyrin repeat protein n=1 Tax=Tasmannia lanceolata TaxID=3420 RepID=UPI004064B89A